MPFRPYPTPFDTDAENEVGNESLRGFIGIDKTDLDEGHFAAAPDCFNFFSDEAFGYYLGRLIELTWDGAGQLSGSVVDALVQIIRMPVGLARRPWGRSSDFSGDELLAILAWLARLETNDPSFKQHTDLLKKGRENVELLYLDLTGRVPAKS